MKEIPKDREILIKVDMGCGELNNYLAFWNDHYDCFIAGVNFFKKERIEAWLELPENKDWNITGNSELLWSEGLLGRDEEHAEVSDLKNEDLK